MELELRIEMIIFESFMTTFEVKIFFEATGTVAKIGSSLTKAMHKLENSVIPCPAEIGLTGIRTVGNVTEINSTSETRK